jgi:hypothetical protein
MFPHRLSEVTAEEIRAVIETEAAEGLDFELKKTLPGKAGNVELWLANGKIADDAKDALAAEMNAFANTIGGTLIIGIDEDTATKRAKPPIIPVPRCKELAARLHQAITDRIEPKLPVFESEGVVTEEDGSSGVVIMRTLESYLAPHRYSQDNKCYVRRDDRSEPMSMREIQELTLYKARAAEQAEKHFQNSSDSFFEWLPENRRLTVPSRNILGAHHQSEKGERWEGMWAMRVTARPLAPFVIDNIPKQPWLKRLDFTSFLGKGDLRRGAHWHDWKHGGDWRPRLRSVEREFRGEESIGLDRITSSGLIERYALKRDYEDGKKPRYFTLEISQLLWTFASVIRHAALMRAALSRPTQHYALEAELMTSDAQLLYGYAASPHAIIPASRIPFPRYEMGDEEGFDELLRTFDRDVWNAGGHNPNWELGLDWQLKSPEERVAEASGRR